MKNEVKIGITEKEEWNKKWESIFDHYQQDLRHAYYINAVLDEEDKKILEIAAGSFRDTAQLNAFGLDCWGTDYSDTSVELAKKHFPLIGYKLFQSDAFDMKDIEDKVFDVTFHNGLWVLFNNNEDIIKLAKEQSRITKNKMIITVHNGHNQQFVDYFKKLSVNDDLYKIRFFQMEEITDLLLNVCKSVKIIPVGKGKKYYEDQMINEGVASKQNLKSFFEKTKLTHLENSERLLCIGEL